MSNALGLQLFGSGSNDIIVNPSWRAVPGEPVPQMNGVLIGARFGAGALALNQIYDLVDASDGSSTHLALKVCKATHAARRSLAHEWKTYSTLKAVGREFPAAATHFLQAHRVLRLANGTIAGFVMEKANGSTVNKTLRQPGFCNARYVIALMRDLLVALDIAQRVLGFAHYDLKLDNVIEHWPGEEPPGMRSQERLMDGVPQFKVFDLGTASVYPDPFALHHAVDDHLHSGPPAAGSILAEQRSTTRGSVVNRDTGQPLYEFSAAFGCVRIYQLWGRRNGDVYRVVSALGRLLDDHMWPVEDVELVSLLLTVLEHTTGSSRRLRARFEPRDVLLRRLLGPNAAPAAQPQQQQQQPANAGATTAKGAGVSSSSRAQQTQALLRQHSQIVLQPSSALTGAASALLPSPSAAAAMLGDASLASTRRPQLMPPQQPAPPGAAALSAHAESPPSAAASSAASAASPFAAAGAAPGPALHVHTSPATPPPPAAAASRQPPPHTDAPASQLPPVSSPRAAPPGTGAGHQPPYTPRRSIEVPRGGALTTTPSGRLESGPAGVAFVRLAKSAADGHGAEAASHGGGGSIAAAAAAAAAAVEARDVAAYTRAATDQTGRTAEGAEGGAGAGGRRRSIGSSNAGGAASSGSGLLTMVGSAPEQRKRQLQALNASLLQQQQVSKQRALTESAGDPPAAGHAAAASSSSVITEEEQRAGGDQGADDNGLHGAGPSAAAMHLQGSAAEIVARQPVAAPAHQSVLGRRKALRSVTAQQLLVEPIVQSLLLKV